MTRPSRPPAIFHPFAALAKMLPPTAPALPVAVAFSGGADSCALLAAACLAYGPAQVRALHVNHGASPTDDQDFEDFSRARAADLGCSFQALLADGRARRGESPEAAARKARYQALAAACPAASICLLGHHAEDQAETLVLALSRGLGLAGLSGMPKAFERHGTRFERPFLALPKAHLRQALSLSGSTWSEDPTNADERFARNLVRSTAMPALEACFPQWSRACARSMRHCAQAQELALDLARLDAAANPRMLLEPLRSLSAARLGNLLRHWLADVHGAHPTEAAVEEAAKHVRASSNPSRAIDIKCGHGRLARVDGSLAFHASDPPGQGMPPMPPLATLQRHP